MHLKTIIYEDFTNYKKPSMFIATCICDWKCCMEQNLPIETCQNQPISLQKTIYIPDEDIIASYLSNSITQAVVFGGLEPILQADEILAFIRKFREKSNDDIIIFTGYEQYEQEVEQFLQELKQFHHIIVKFGRYNPNKPPYFNDLLGVELISSNQYAVKIS